MIHSIEFMLKLVMCRPRDHFLGYSRLSVLSPHETPIQALEGEREKLKIILSPKLTNSAETNKKSTILNKT